MGLVGFILFFVFIWVIFMIVMAIFAIICIIFSALSTSCSKQFLVSRQYPDYKKAKGRFVPALIFFILTCFTSAGTLLSLEIFLDEAMSGGDVLDPYVLFFFVCPALLIVAVVLGIRCFVWFNRAERLNKQLTAGLPFAAPFAAPVQAFNVCPYCGFPNETKNRFCVKCGGTMAVDR